MGGVYDELVAPAIRVPPLLLELLLLYHWYEMPVPLAVTDRTVDDPLIHIFWALVDG